MRRRSRCHLTVLLFVIVIVIRRCSSFLAEFNNRQHFTTRLFERHSTSIAATTASSPPTTFNATQTFLFSLKWAPEPTSSSLLSLDDQGSYHTAKPVRDLWKWKDQILGDGRDFFVPKPKTLMALQSYIIKECPSLSGKGSECVILSNCARFEIMVRVALDGGRIEAERLADDISMCLTAQIKHYTNVNKQQSNGWKQFIMAAVSPSNSADRPEDVLTKESVQNCNHAPVPFDFWQVLEGSEQILPHLCRIAAGMAPRPKRPDRPVLFRPFSSRDAHVLLQLKRTREIAVDHSQQAEEDAKRKTKLSLLLECALRAGKAARNPEIVPEIESLRDEYKASSSSASTKEQTQSDEIAKAAYTKAIQPLIEQYLDKERLSASNVNQEIACLRNSCLAMVDPQVQDEIRWMNQRLHGVTMELREKGQLESFEDAEECIAAIQHDLNVFRRSSYKTNALS